MQVSKSQGLCTVVVGQGNLDKTWKVREFKFKSQRQSSENKLILFKEKVYLSKMIVQAHLLPHWVLFLKEILCYLGSKCFFL